MAKREPLNVEIGQRYVLKLPRSVPYGHQLHALFRDLTGWLDDSRYWDDREDEMCAEPVWLFGQPTVTVRDITVIEPVSDEGPEYEPDGLLALDIDGNVMMRCPEWDPLPAPEPAAVIHLTRWPREVKASVILTDEQVAKLDLGLDPHLRYVIEGRIDEVDERGYRNDPETIEEKDFIVPVTWLRSLQDIRPWKNKAEREYDLALAALAVLPEIEQQWLRAEKKAQEAEAHFQSRAEVRADTEDWVRNRVPDADKADEWQRLREQRQLDYDSAQSRAVEARQEADRLRQLLDGEKDP